MKEVKDLLNEAKKHLNEYQGNEELPKDSNWATFADVFNIGVLDMDNFASYLKFRDFNDLDISISPIEIYKRKPGQFVDSLQKSSLTAQDMSGEEIEMAMMDKNII